MKEAQIKYTVEQLSIKLRRKKTTCEIGEERSEQSIKSNIVRDGSTCNTEQAT